MFNMLQAEKEKIVTLKRNRVENIVQQWGEIDYDFLFL